MCAGAVTHVAVVSIVMRMSNASFSSGVACGENLGRTDTVTSVGATLSRPSRRYTPRPCTPFTEVVTTRLGRTAAP